MNALLQPVRIKGGAVLRAQFFRASNNLRWLRPHYAKGRALLTNKLAAPGNYTSRAFFGELQAQIEFLAASADAREFIEEMVFTVGIEFGIATLAAFDTAVDMALMLSASGEGRTDYNEQITQELLLAASIRGRISGWEPDQAAADNVWVPEAKPKLF